MRNPQLEVFGLFPSFDSLGGVQASGREAWNGIVDTVGAHRVVALNYAPGGSKARAVLRTIGTRKKSRVILIWHLHLLKLLPCLDYSSSHVILFLHGIEAWVKHGPLTRHLLERVTLFLSNSDYTWAQFLKFNPAFKTMPHRTVRLGVSSRLQNVTRRPSSLPVVLMVGRLQAGEDYKGHREMIEAWSLILERMPDAQLWIVGS
jgi:glycosyltransferase involved in cell wall biosynthesis